MKEYRLFSYGVSRPSLIWMAIGLLLRSPVTNVSEEIRTAYRRESLKTHPDRLSPKAAAAERRRYTERFVRLVSLPALH